MTNDAQQEPTAPWDMTEDEIAILVSGIERSRIVKLVKHSSHLHQHVFRGFRPSRLPWNQVPSRLARDAYGDPGNIDTLTTLWVASNDDLLGEVENIPPDRIREGVAELLARRGVESKLQLLWALRLDDREEVQQALKDGLADEITAETSELLSQVQRNVLVMALEAAQTQVAEQKKKLAEAEATREDNRRLLLHKNEQLEASRDRVTELETDREHLLARVAEQAGDQKRLEAELLAVQQQLAEEQAVSAELRQSIRDLKSTLQAQIESSRQEETQQRLNEALLALEEERKETAGLRLKLGKLEQHLENVHAKRDEEQDRNETLVQQLQRLGHDKEVIIEEKRKLTRGLEGLQSKLDRARRQLRDQAVHETLEVLPLSELDGLWSEERETIRDYLHALMGSLKVENETPSSGVDKWDVWSQWLEREASLVHDVLTTLDDEIHFDSVNSLENAQQLLTLRWYLLEYTRQAMLLALQELAFPV